MFGIEFEHDYQESSSELLALDVYLGRNRRQADFNQKYLIVSGDIEWG